MDASNILRNKEHIAFNIYVYMIISRDNSVKRLATDWTTGIQFPVGARIFVWHWLH